jgi:hypothetical protein
MPELGVRQTFKLQSRYEVAEFFLTTDFVVAQIVIDSQHRWAGVKDPAT